MTGLKHDRAEKPTSQPAEVESGRGADRRRSAGGQNVGVAGQRSRGHRSWLCPTVREEISL